MAWLLTAAFVTLVAGLALGIAYSFVYTAGLLASQPVVVTVAVAAGILYAAFRKSS